MPSNREVELILRLKDEATNTWQKFGAQLEQGVNRLQQQFQRFGGIVAGAFSTVALERFVHASNEQEVASAKLASALKTQGVQGDETRLKMEEFSKALQKITTFADEDITKLQAMLVGMTGLTGQAVEPLTKAVLNLSTGLNISTDQATRMIGKTIEGADALKRLGITIGETHSEEERLAKVTEEVNKRFGGLAEAVGSTGAGKITQFKNALNDVQEKFGDIIKRIAGEVLPIIQKFLSVLENAPVPLQAATLAVGGLTAAITVLNAALLANPLTYAFIALGAATIYLVSATIEYNKASEEQKKNMQDLLIIAQTMNGIWIGLQAIMHLVVVAVEGFLNPFVQLFALIERGLNMLGANLGNTFQVMAANLNGTIMYHMTAMEKLFIGTEAKVDKSADATAANMGKIETASKGVTLNDMRENVKKLNDALLVIAPSADGYVEALRKWSIAQHELQDAEEKQKTLSEELFIQYEKHRLGLDKLVGSLDMATIGYKQMSKSILLPMPSIADLEKALSDVNERARNLHGNPEGLKTLGEQARILTGEIEKMKAAMGGGMSAIVFPTDSIAGMSEELAKLETELDGLSQKSPRVAELTKQIEELRQKLGEAGQSDIQKVGQAIEQWAPLAQRALGLIDQAESQASQANIDRIQSEGDHLLKELDRRKAAEIKVIDQQKTADIKAIDLRLKSEILSTEERKKLELDKFNISNQLDEQKKAIEDKYAIDRAATEKHLADMVREEKTKAFNQHKSIAILESIVNTAVAVTKMLSSAAPPANFILAAIVGAMGLVQTAIIASQPAPSFHTGTGDQPVSDFIKSASSSQGFPIIVRGGETIRTENQEKSMQTVLREAQKIIQVVPSSFHSGTGDQSLLDFIKTAAPSQEFQLMATGGETVRTEAQEKAMQGVIIQAKEILKVAESDTFIREIVNNNSIQRFHDGGVVGDSIDYSDNKTSKALSQSLYRSNSQQIMNRGDEIHNVTHNNYLTMNIRVASMTKEEIKKNVQDGMRELNYVTVDDYFKNNRANVKF